MLSKKFVLYMDIAVNYNWQEVFTTREHLNTLLYEGSYLFYLDIQDFPVFYGVRIRNYDYSYFQH